MRRINTFKVLVFTSIFSLIFSTIIIFFKNINFNYQKDKFTQNLLLNLEETSKSENDNTR